MPTPVSWSAISKYVESVYLHNGNIERSEVMNLALKDNVSEDTIDAIDAIGSRVFRSVDDAKTYLVTQKWVKA